LKLGIETHSLVKHKTIAVIVGSAALFEILEDSAIELKDLLEPLALHERAGFFTANSAGTEHDDRPLFHFIGKCPYGFRELPKLIDIQCERVVERSQFHFVIVPRV